MMKRIENELQKAKGKGIIQDYKIEDNTIGFSYSSKVAWHWFKIDSNGVMSFLYSHNLITGYKSNGFRKGARITKVINELLGVRLFYW